MATIGRGAAVVQMLGGRTMKGKAAQLAWGTVHLALLPTNEDRAKAVVDWAGARPHAPARGPDHRRDRTSGDERRCRMTATQRRGRADAAEGRRRSKPADVFVVFGITGDLAKVMTFRSLYRLERRGLLDCPIVGVAVDDWTVDQLRERARESIVGTGEQLDDEVFDRLRGAALLRLRRLRRRRDLRARRRGDQGRRAAGLLPRDPAVPVRRGRQGTCRRRADEERARRRREAVRPRPRVGRCARRRAAPVHRRVAALPDRPLPREDGARGDPPPPLRERDARAGLEPELPRVASRSRWPRTSASRTAATSTTRSVRCATSSSTT